MCKSRNVTQKVNMSRRNKKRRLPTVREEPKKSDFMIYAMVITVALLTYCNSLNGDFIHDDIPAIMANGDVTGTNPLMDLFFNDFWGMSMLHTDSHKSYRPLTTLSFRLNHILSGLRPWWWHASNVALHAVCCVLVARASLTVARLRRPFAALAALLFAVHPIHTEAVAGLVGRADVLACVFFLSSLLMYNRTADSEKCVWTSVGLGTISMLAKETGITVLLLSVLFDFYKCWPFVKRSWTFKKMEKKFTRLTLRGIKVGTSLVLLIYLRLALQQGTWPIFSIQDNQAAFHPSFVVRLMTFSYLAAFNWWLLLCPWSLSHDWQMGSVPLVLSAWDSRNMLTCAAFFVLLAISYRSLADCGRRTPAVIGMLLLVIPFLPASNLPVTVGFVVAERVLYIPSIGSVILTAYGAQLLWYSKPGRKIYLIAGLAVLATSGFAKTYRRNADWQDRGTLLKADLVVLPQNAKLHYNYANFLRETNQHDAAIEHYKEAISLWPEYASAYNNMGTLITKFNVAELHFLEAIKFNPNHMNAHLNLASLYKQTGNKLRAIFMLETCIKMQPSFVAAHQKLLALNPTSAQNVLTTLVQLKLHNLEHFMLFGNWWKERGFARPASIFYLEATRLHFKHRSDKPQKGNIVSYHKTAIMYRAMGQKSRMLQLITRWHTWRRGWLNPAAVHIVLRDWILKRRARVYSETITPKKIINCINHTQLAVDSKQGELKINDGEIVLKSDETPETDECACKDCGAPTHLRTIRIKLETDLEDQECGLSEKDKDSEEASNMSVAEHIRL